MSEQACARALPYAAAAGGGGGGGAVAEGAAVALQRKRGASTVGVRRSSSFHNVRASNRSSLKARSGVVRQKDEVPPYEFE